MLLTLTTKRLDQQARYQLPYYALAAVIALAGLHEATDGQQMMANNHRKNRHNAKSP
jgi:hypothetical protein